jgi:hypothetical protein
MVSVVFVSMLSTFLWKGSTSCKMCRVFAQTFRHHTRFHLWLVPSVCDPQRHGRGYCKPFACRPWGLALHPRGWCIVASSLLLAQRHECVRNHDWITSMIPKKYRNHTHPISFWLESWFMNLAKKTNLEEYDSDSDSLVWIASYAASDTCIDLGHPTWARSSSCTTTSTVLIPYPCTCCI